MNFSPYGESSCWIRPLHEKADNLRYPLADCTASAFQSTLRLSTAIVASWTEYWSPYAGQQVPLVPMPQAKSRRRYSGSSRLARARPRCPPGAGRRRLYRDCEASAPSWAPEAPGVGAVAALARLASKPCHSIGACRRAKPGWSARGESVGPVGQPGRVGLTPLPVEGRVPAELEATGCRSTPTGHQLRPDEQLRRVLSGS